MQFNVLGPVTATDGGESLPLGGPKQRTVLAILIAGAGNQVSLETIVEAVWGEQPISNARRNVQTYVATLRSVLGDVIMRDSYGWRLDVEPQQIDAIAFADLCESARLADVQHSERAGVILREGLGLWRGLPYADIEAHGALDAEIARLNELRTAALAARIDADLGAGRDADLIGEIEVLLGQHPYSERFRAQHMLALYRSGRQQEALRSYRDMQSVLLDELGVDPTAELRDLEGQILNQDPALRSARGRVVARKTVVVVNPCDPVELSHMPSDERAELLDGLEAAIDEAVNDEPDSVVVAAGATRYLVLGSAGVAATTAMRLAQSGYRPSLGVDSGGVVLDSGRIEGAPVSRAAIFAAMSHRGQILLSSEAQHAIGADSDGDGFRFAARGTHSVPGLDAETLIYELLVDGQPAFPDLDTNRMPPPLPREASRSVPGYELREPLGPGSLGTLHRAFQPSVGREVLVEVIGRTEAAAPGFVRDFEANAHRLALLDHRNLASVLDYWRDPEGAYVVYPFPRGGILTNLAAVDGERVVQDVAAALAYAHSLGMVHGSVRPDRILLDGAGYASLVGFPIGGRSDRNSIGFPAYIAPETLAGDAASVATDVYCLAVLAHELRSGPLAPDAPIAPTDPALARALAADPADRPATVAELMEAIGGDPATVNRDRFTQTRNPYKGLAAFHELDAGDFFGRTAVVDELVERLGASPFLAIVGPSGVGKSSVARAGLIPALRAGRIDGSDQWLVTEMLPGSHPFLELRRAVERVAVEPPAAVSEALAAWQSSAMRDVASFLPSGAPLVLLIDQFEELFTLTAQEERDAFLELIAAIVADGTARVVITLRADFLDHPLGYSDFGELLRGAMVTLRAPSIGELAEAIEKPATKVGVSIEPDVVHRVVSEVHDQPGGAMPLLQHALAELFDARTSDVIDEALFETTGGVAESLARKAEAIHDSLSTEQQAAIRQVFLRLVAISDDGPPTRRRLRLIDVAHLQAEDAIDAFSRARMLVHDNDRDTRSPTIELAHEALLSHWPRLAGWIDGGRDELRLSRRLDEAAREWSANERNDDYLLSGAQLEQHQAWTSEAELQLSEQEKVYLQTSVTHENLARAAAQRRRRRVLTAFAGAAAVAIILAAVAVRNAALATNNERAANAEALAANAIATQEIDPTLSLLLSLEAHRRSPSIATTTALHQSLQADRQIMTIPPPEGSGGAAAVVDPLGTRVAVAGYFTSIVQLWEIGGAEPVWERRLSEDPDAGLLPLGAFWFSEDGAEIYVPLGWSAQESPTGPGVGLYTLDAETGETLDFWAWPCLVRAYPVGANYRRSNEPFLFDWAEDWPDEPGTDCLGDIWSTMVDIDTETAGYELQDGSFGPPSGSSDGRLIARSIDLNGEGRDGLITQVIDTDNGETILEVVGAGLARLSDDGTRLLADSNPTYLIDVASGERLASYQGNINRIFFSPSGKRVVGSGAGGTVQIFDVETGAELLSLRGHTSQIRGASVDLAERILVSSGFDAARVWDIADLARGDLPSIPLETVDQNRFPGDAISTADGLALVHRGVPQPSDPPRPHEADFIDLASGQLIRSQIVFSAALGPNGTMVVQPVLSEDVTSPSGVAGAALIGAPELVDPVTGEPIRLLDGCDYYWVPFGDYYETETTEDCDVAAAPDYNYWEFSADGSRIVGSNQLGAVKVWETGSGRPAYHRDAVQEVVGGFNQGVRFGASLSPDGGRLVIPPAGDGTSGEPGAVRVIEIETGEEQGRFDVERWVNFTTFDNNGNLIAASDRVQIVDTEQWTASSLSQTQGARIDDLALSPDGRLAAIVTPDSSLTVWDLVDQSLRAEIPVIGSIGEGLRGVAFANETTILVVPAQGTGILRFTIDETELADQAAIRLTRSFLPEECVTYDIAPCPTLTELQTMDN